jgi:hypothetical protein
LCDAQNSLAAEQLELRCQFIALCSSRHCYAKSTALEHATIWNRFRNRTDASFDALVREGVLNHLLLRNYSVPRIFFAQMLDSMASQALS